jgi:hypothetical protein
MLLRTLDGKAFIVEKVADSLEKRDIIRPVITPATASLERAKGGEFCFPEPQNMGRNVQMVRNLGNGPEGI